MTEEEAIASNICIARDPDRILAEFLLGKIIIVWHLWSNTFERVTYGGYDGDYEPWTSNYLAKIDLKHLHKKKRMPYIRYKNDDLIYHYICGFKSMISLLEKSFPEWRYDY